MSATSPFPPVSPMMAWSFPPAQSYGGGGAGPTYGGQNGFTSRAAEWIFNQSGMVVILTLGLLGVWYVGRDHLSEFKAIRTEEKIEAKAERAKFISALEACCKGERLSGFGN